MDDKYIWEVVTRMAKFSNCKKRQVGAVIYNTKYNRIVGRGINSHEDGICDCNTTRTAHHAETQALANMKERDLKFDRKDLVLYVNHHLCVACASALETEVYEIRFRSQH